MNWLLWLNFLTASMSLIIIFLLLGSVNVSTNKEVKMRRKVPCRPALVSTDNSHSEKEEERRWTFPKWREGSRENSFDHTRVLKTSSTPRERTSRKSTVLLGKVYILLIVFFKDVKDIWSNMFYHAVAEEGQGLLVGYTIVSVWWHRLEQANPKQAGTEWSTSHHFFRCGNLAK